MLCLLDIKREWFIMQVKAMQFEIIPVIRVQITIA